MVQNGTRHPLTSVLTVSVCPPQDPTTSNRNPVISSIRRSILITRNRPTNHQFIMPMTMQHVPSFFRYYLWHAKMKCSDLHSFKLSVAADYIIKEVIASRLRVWFGDAMLIPGNLSLILVAETVRWSWWSSPYLITRCHWLSPAPCLCLTSTSPSRKSCYQFGINYFPVVRAPWCQVEENARRAIGSFGNGANCNIGLFLSLHIIAQRLIFFLLTCASFSYRNFSQWI